MQELIHTSKNANMLALSGFKNCEGNCYYRENNKYKPNGDKYL